MTHDAPIPPGYSAYTYYACRCDECRAANAAYRRRYLATPEGRAKTRRAHRAEGKALRRLRRAHLEEYRQYYQEALDAEA